MQTRTAPLWFLFQASGLASPNNKANKLFPPQLAFGRCFYHRDRKQMRSFFLVVLYILCSLSLIIFIIKVWVFFLFCVCPLLLEVAEVATFLLFLVLTSTRHFLQRWPGHGNLTIAAYFRKILFLLNFWRLVFLDIAFLIYRVFFVHYCFRSLGDIVLSSSGL